MTLKRIRLTVPKIQIHKKMFQMVLTTSEWTSRKKFKLFSKMRIKTMKWRIQMKKKRKEKFQIQIVKLTISLSANSKQMKSSKLQRSRPIQLRTKTQNMKSLILTSRM